MFFSKKINSWLLVFILIFTSLNFVPTESEALNISYFRAGNIISDSKFFTHGTLTVKQIQSFLDSKGNQCKSIPSQNLFCIKDLKITTKNVEANKYCNAYVGAKNESVAQIISKFSKNCNISEKVLLVTLQKEQGLITTPYATYVDPNGNHAKDGWAYRAAMGFGCPDGGACNSKYYGLFNQLDQATWQYIAYVAGDYNYTYKPYQTIAIKYNPNSSCGSSKVYIENKATAALYNYTPYQPNKHAIAAVTGASSNACASYGNRNFFNYYNNWFGNSRVKSEIGKAAVIPEASELIDITHLTSARQKAINQIVEAGIITPCTKVSFCPDKLLGRDALAKYLLLSIGTKVTPKEKSSYFKDVSSKTVKIKYAGDSKTTTIQPLSKNVVAYIDALYEMKLTLGTYKDNKGNLVFKPKNSVTRAELAQFLFGFHNIVQGSHYPTLTSKNTKSDFADVSTKKIKVVYSGEKKATTIQKFSQKRVYAINWMYENNIIWAVSTNNKGKITFRPNDKVNRGQFAQILTRMLNKDLLLID